MLRLARTEFWFALAALLGVLTFGTLPGVFIGVGLSLLWLIWRTSHPAIPVLGRAADGRSYHSLDNHPDSTTFPGLVIIRFDGPLFFATAGSLRARIRELTHEMEPPVQAVLLDMESTTIIDLEGSDELKEVAKELKEVGIALHLARVKENIRQTLVRDGVLETIPEANFHTSVESAMEAAQNHPTTILEQVNDH